ncbi:MAG: peptidoglycan-binding protein [Acidobacteriota bacterium]
MLNDLQKRTGEAIVNIFETGHPLGIYGQVTLIKGDTGHLTYGRSQTTLASGNLYLLIKAYCDVPDAQFATQLGQYLGRLASRDATLDTDMTFRGLLRDAGDDPDMHTVQDRFFDRVYWNPSQKDAEALSLSSALGTTVVYDSHVHGSWGRIRNLTVQNHGKPPDVSEQDWIGFYVSERRNWLATNPNSALHVTVYRMDTFNQLIGAQNWDLALPITVRGIRVDQEILIADKPVRVSAHDASERTLLLQTPFMVGDDVEAVQRALVQAGIAVDVDGIYGHLTEAAVRRFQQKKGLTADGVVGPATRSALGL